MDILMNIIVPILQVLAVLGLVGWHQNYNTHLVTTRIDNLELKIDNRINELTSIVIDLDKSFAIHLNDHKHLDSNR